MGQVKRLWQDKIEKVHEDYINNIIDFTEGYNRLCRLGLEPDYARDSLDSVKQLDLFEKEN